MNRDAGGESSRELLLPPEGERDGDHDEEGGDGEDADEAGESMETLWGALRQPGLKSLLLIMFLGWIQVMACVFYWTAWVGSVKVGGSVRGPRASSSGSSSGSPPARPSVYPSIHPPYASLNPSVYCVFTTRK